MLFLTVGCSFTEGERLFYHKWAEEARSNYENATKLLSVIDGPSIDPNSVRQFATWGDCKYMREVSFSGLLSKTLNCDYFTWTGNNDSNINESISTYVDISNEFDYRKLDFIVLQLTDPQRDLGARYNKEIKDFSKEEFIEEYNNILRDTIKELDEANKLCLDNDIDLLVWSWQNELARLLKDKEFFIKIQYESKEYISFEDARKELPVTLSQELASHGVTDHHPNKFFNQILHDSIVSKLKLMGYNIN
jgi:hypothetical protein